MTPERILITGGSGFVGRHLLPALSRAFPNATIDAVGTDLTDRVALASRVRHVRPDACVHLAAVSALREARRDPDHAWGVNLHGTLNLATAILADAPNCMLLFVSSADAYGSSFRSGQPLDEMAPLAPMNAYAATKAAADLAIGALAAEGLRAIRVRPFNHTGPGQPAEFVVPGIAEQVARIAAGLQPPVVRIGALDPQRDFLDVRDVCAAYVACLQHAEALPAGTIINIASGTPRSVRSVLEALLALGRVDARIETDPARLRGSDIPVACGDASRAHALLHWRPAIAWEQTLRDTLTYWQERLRQPQ